MITQQALRHGRRHVERFALFHRRGYKALPFVPLQPQVIAARQLAAWKGTTAANVLPAALAIENACEDVENQSIRRRSARVDAIDLAEFGHLDGSSPALTFRQTVPGRQPFFEHLTHVVGLLAILAGQQLAGRGQTVDSLARLPLAAPVGVLLGHAAEKGALGVTAPALIPIVAGDGDEFLADELDDFLIGESERTARDAVVSGAAERMAVHLPQQDGLALCRGLSPRFPQVRQPGDAVPARFFLRRLDQQMQIGELIVRQRFDGVRGRSACQRQRTNSQARQPLHRIFLNREGNRWASFVGPPYKAV